MFNFYFDKNKRSYSKYCYIFAGVLTASSSTSYPPEITVEPELRVAELNSTWVKLEWRTFTEFELQFIDGVQLRYKEPDGKVS